MPRTLHLWFAVLGAMACSSPSRPPALTDDTPLHDSGLGPTGGGGGGCVDDVVVPPLPDAQGLCGNTFLNATSDPPNIYFVIDASGSMLEIVDGRQKYDAVAAASVALVRKLGAQANVGAALFPGPLLNPNDGCTAGQEAFPTQPGDSLQVGVCSGDGAVTRQFSRSISTVPNGGTPTAATLARLLPTLAALPGRTAVILATDGGPNCNLAAMCDETKCIPNIEHDPLCPTGVNCCSPGLAGAGACLDDVATLSAVAALARRDIKTYVIGIPGSTPYATLLDELARVGGTARPAGSSAAYYDVDHLTELDDILAAIGSTVILSCHLHLDMPPRESSMVNIYLDHQLVQYGAPDGWVWTNLGDAGTPVDGGASDASTEDAPSNEDATTPGDDADPDAIVAPEASTRAPRQDIDLLGVACDSLMSGKIRQVQVVFGCPTVTPK